MILRARTETCGNHVHVRLFAGKHEGALGICGTVLMRPEEWAAFRDVLAAGGRWATSGAKVEIVEATPEAIPAQTEGL